MHPLLMENLFRTHQSYTRVFFDDCIVYSKSLEDHMIHLHEVFKVLRAHKLYINRKKSEFFLEEIQYLGHIISKLGIRMDLEKLEVINAWLVPKNIHELCSFIGMCRHYAMPKPYPSFEVDTTP